MAYDGDYQGDTTTSEKPKEYSLGEPACDVYERLSVKRTGVIETARVMSELTIPSLVPPQGWKAGDKIPGNNQSVGARCVNNLAASLLFIAFPPNQPILKLEAIEYEVQEEIDKDPELWAKLEVSLARLAESHRKRFLSSTTILSAYSHALKLLIVGGNCLWKHIKLATPTVWDPCHYVCKRDSEGNPLMSVLKECKELGDLAPDIRDWLYSYDPDLRSKKLWEHTVDIYSVCNLVVDDPEAEATVDIYGKENHPGKHWEYWQEYEGKMVPDTDVETDFDDPPMIPLWFIPVYGQNWGRSYCEEYRGDLFTAEALSSGVNDGAALSALSLLFVDPAGRSSVKQIREARNLSTFSGKATDLTVFRAEKGADLQFVQATMDRVEHRLSAAFLLNLSIQRNGERVTAEEIRRLGNDLDKALGGLYSEQAQRTQRPILLRAMRLNEAENSKLPKLPRGVVEVQVITGVDALGNSKEAQDLEDLAAGVEKFFPKDANAIINGPGWALRYATAKGIKPDGLIRSTEEITQQQTRDRNAALKQTLLEKGTGPATQGAMDLAGNAQEAALAPPDQSSGATAPSPQQPQQQG